jgi:glucose/arabinose dehydrogenase
MKTLTLLGAGLALSTLPLLAAVPVVAQQDEADFYQITTFDTPAATALEVSSIELLPDDRLALGTRRGEIWMVKGAELPQPNLQYTLFASGQHEVMGLAWNAKEQVLYAVNRYEVLRLRDTDGDGRADRFETVNDQWGVSGDYHEYAFGSPFDKNGDLWVTLCLTGSFTSEAEFRGWALRVKPDGTMTPTCSGIRSPAGIGFDADGEVYYSDNQGPWHGSSTVQHLIPGTFQGHPGGFKWYELAPNMGPQPVEPNDKSRMVAERERVKELVPPAVYMVHGKIGNSTSFITCDLSGGKFGPFAKQLFVADQSHSNVSRVNLETVNGVKQGVVIPFRKGFKSGLIGGRMDSAHGYLFAGGSDRGWGAKGGQPYSFERLQWTGKVPFEVHEVHAKPDGFELTFTEPVDAASAADPKSYSLREFTYIYRAEYGSPEVDDVLPTLESATVAKDQKSVRLKITPLTKGHIHEIHLEGVKSASGRPLLHNVAYYTLNEIPAR